MDLVSLTRRLPFAPLRGVLAVARLLQDEADEPLYSPADVRREVEEINSAQAIGGLAGERGSGRAAGV